MTSTSRKSRASETVARQRRIQSTIDRSDAKKKSEQKPKKKAVQAGPRREPENPLPPQHQKKPGSEADLSPAPRFEAPDYRGSGKLEGRVALVTGADSGIGRAVAVLFAREGANVAVVYLSQSEDAEKTAEAVRDEGRECLLIQGDVRDPDFCEDAVERTIAEFGKLDVLVNNAAFQQHAD
jgi:hypothetical protein